MPKHKSNSNNSQIKFALITMFIPPAFLFSAQGVVTLQLINHYHVPLAQVKYLDLLMGIASIMTSLLLSSASLTLKHKPTMITGALIEIIACLTFLHQPSFLTASFLFVCIGIGFIFIKIPTFCLIHSTTRTQTEHTSQMLLQQCCFMVGLLSGFWGFKHFIISGDWLANFKITCILFIISICVVLKTHFKQSTRPTAPAKHSQHVYTSFCTLLRSPMILIALTGLFFYEGIEVGLSTWLPTFDNKLLHISASSSLAADGLFIVGVASGRLAGVLIIRHFRWNNILIGCVIATFTVLVLMVESIHSLQSSTHLLSQSNKIPWSFYLTPIIGFFLGPILPTLESVALASQPTQAQTPITALLTISQTLGYGLHPFIIGIM